MIMKRFPWAGLKVLAGHIQPTGHSSENSVLDENRKKEREISFSLRHHVSLPHSIANLTQL